MSKKHRPWNRVPRWFREKSAKRFAKEANSANLPPMRYLVISCSLNTESKSRLLARAAFGRLPHDQTDWLDLAKLDLPVCDGDQAFAHPEVIRLREAVEGASGILLATPVYNYNVSASAKNLVELTGQAWAGKVAGLLCAAGGPHGYMGGMPLLNSLMLDFRTFILPKFVYSQGNVFVEGKIADETILQRVHGLADELVRVTDALHPSAPAS